MACSGRKPPPGGRLWGGRRSSGLPDLVDVHQEGSGNPNAGMVQDGQLLIKSLAKQPGITGEVHKYIIAHPSLQTPPVCSDRLVAILSSRKQKPQVVPLRRSAYFNFSDPRRRPLPLPLAHAHSLPPPAPRPPSLPARLLSRVGPAAATPERPAPPPRPRQVRR